MAQATTTERFLGWLKTMTFYELLVGMKATMSHLIHYKPITMQYPHEKRKLACAKKHFNTLDINYRHITADVEDWYRLEPAQDDLFPT